ncbi:MAG: homocysteine S-methyltransferase family protein [Synergistaceae bacterium]|nr:homocysteine S-methyltransferase family protein [Synergistaceae bacterium]MDD4444984.1 homocysteine S-methyltransferase family protein [Eubacteriales bacterium]
MKIERCISQGTFFLDGGTGSMLQRCGLHPGELPETWNLTHPAEIVKLHKAYYEAGSHAVVTNTFGANALKFDGKGGNPSVTQIVKAAVLCAREAHDLARGGQRERFIALDIGPLGRLMAPLGDISFERAVQLFSEIVQAGDQTGADFIFIETMGDSYETKAAVVAAKENSSLPIFVSNAYQLNGRTQSGATPEVMAILLQGLGVSALGANCSMGPEQMLNLLPQFTATSGLPLIVKPNAGLPHPGDTAPVYDVGPKAFARFMGQAVLQGAAVVGGCCGTTPAHIEAMVREVQLVAPNPVSRPTPSLPVAICSESKVVTFGQEPVLIGERINPTGRKELREALLAGDVEYAVKEALKQKDCGARVLDVNTGIPGADEPALLACCVEKIQQSCNLPLQLDTADTRAMERALRNYNGKPMVNSVNGNAQSMSALFPLIRKYGGVAVCLTLDEHGIPETAEGRLKIAKKILQSAIDYGVPLRNLIFDPLVMTVASHRDAASVALEAVRLIRDQLGCGCLLGISNVSFGLPDRDRINGTFLTMALTSGVDAVIADPCSRRIRQTIENYRALTGLDLHCNHYIHQAKENLLGRSVSLPHGITEEDSACLGLRTAIEEGLCETAVLAAKKGLTEFDPLELINRQILPALDLVGQDFESGDIFLPQLILCAQAAKYAFDEIRKSMPATAIQGPTVILATVRNDIHDIGKNIVKTLLENYGYRVVDLGKDVPPETIVAAAIAEDASLVGLSALMTTTIPSMRETIGLIREKLPDCKIIVGGAVLTEEYAAEIGADHWGKTAMDTVRYAQQLFGE